MLERLSSPLPSSLTLGLLACMVCAAASGGIAYGFGYRHAEAQGAASLSALVAKHATQASTTAEANSERMLQQITRASEAAGQMLALLARLDTEQQPIQERIPHVTSTYRPEPAAAPEPIPRCVFTVGWLRDYNTALGVPGAAIGPVAGPAGQTPWAAPGADAELLESGVTPADILAHAQDYGRWARSLASQVTGLLTAREAGTP
ncbi:lysis protein [Pseudomonas stutzeri]|uniref:lysis protein n=1 Tax=Stutzerimonas stutzeri TaxID=316 RepID=UPI00210B4641|nr:lysis protein [Stutzerimonas stutzeri]MCQ4310901.1 lysis protein [Stutzerimonas stutzeri]